MHKIFKVIFICFFLCPVAKGQVVFNKAYFENTIWASLNKDSLFFTLDTIKMVKINKKLPLNDKNTMQVDAFFNEHNYVTLDFMKHKKLKFYSHDVRTWMRTTQVGTYRWGFKDIDRSLNLFFEGELIASFIPIYEKETQVPPFYVAPPIQLPPGYVDPPIPTKEITLVRVR